MTYIHRSEKKNIKCIKTTSNVEQKPAYNSFGHLDGSVIEYLPMEGSSYIVYDYTTYFATDMGNAANAGVKVKLQIGDSSSSYSDIVTNNTNYTTQHGATYHETGHIRRHFLNKCLRLKYTIPISDWPRDSNNALKIQTLLIRIGSYGANLSILHGTQTDNLARDDNAIVHYDPFVLVYSL